jgi:enterobactin synthetase component D
MISNYSPTEILWPENLAPVVRDAEDRLAHLTDHSAGFLFEPSFFDIEVDGVVAVEARYNLSAFHPSLFNTLGVPKPEAMTKAVQKRQGEFLAGRVLAQTALGLLGHQNVSIAIGKHRAPIWPAGLSGSISHAEGRCVCVVIPDERATVGIDIEKIASGSSLEAILGQTLDPGERKLIAGQTGFYVNVSASLVFSAKETLFKALYPIVGKYFDFDAAQLVYVLEDYQLCLKLTRSLHATLPASSRFMVQYSIAVDHVRTWLIHRTDTIVRPTRQPTASFST